jgi:hypothetical protein
VVVLDECYSSLSIIIHPFLKKTTMTFKISNYYPKSSFEKILFVVIFLKILSLILPIEFSNYGFREDFKMYHSIIIAILAIIWLAIQIFSAKNQSTFMEIFMAFVLGFISLIVLFVMWFYQCRLYQGVEIYFKNNEEEKIELRTLNCDEEYDRNYYYVRPITPYFNFIWKTDTNSIDKKNWIRPKKAFF